MEIRWSSPTDRTRRRRLSSARPSLDLRRIRERGVTLLVIEHVMKAIRNVSDRIMVLHHGELIAEGTPDEIRANDQVRRVYLGQGD